MSVLVSTMDHSAPSSLLHTQLELEAGVGIEPTDRSFAVSEMRFTAFQRVRQCSTGSTKTGKVAKKRNAGERRGTSVSTWCI